MPLSDELSKLDELHQRGALSDGEFSRAKARVLGIAPALNRLQRSRSERWLGGVCGGLAELTGIAAWLWRLAFALSVLCAGTGVAIYALLWVFVPNAPAQPSTGPAQYA